jgi:alkaline phosphatase D
MQFCTPKGQSNKSTAVKHTNQLPKIQNGVDFTLAFGSCANQDEKNTFWKDIEQNQSDVWIWGGDLVYGQSKRMNQFKAAFQKQKQNADYQDFIKKTKVIGVWDDHDYGVNDGGLENPDKKEVQQVFLDFFDVPKDDPRRKKEGVYFSEIFEVKEGKSIKVILLDTRYFRTPLTDDKKTKKRYKPNEYGEGTMLGEVQWNWLDKELKDSKADFNIIVSSIQFLAYEHGFETWANMPHESDKLKNMIRDSKAKGTIILSGDRHISEISKVEVTGLPYPLYDFTSSGLTHSYEKSTETNPLRVTKLITVLSFGLLKFDFDKNTVLMEMRGTNDILLDSVKAQF